MATKSDIESGSIPDKQYLYGKFQEGQDWRSNLHKKLAHKSLDIGLDDEVNVDNSRTATGMGWKELAVIAAAGLGGTGLFMSLQPQPSQPAPQVSPLPDSDYVVRFFDKDGNLIDVPHISKRPQE